jgi:hypothetical protein
MEEITWYCFLVENAPMIGNFFCFVSKEDSEREASDIEPLDLGSVLSLFAFNKLETSLAMVGLVKSSSALFFFLLKPKVDFFFFVKESGSTTGSSSSKRVSLSSSLFPKPNKDFLFPVPQLRNQSAE